MNYTATSVALKYSNVTRLLKLSTLLTSFGLILCAMLAISYVGHFTGWDKAHRVIATINNAGTTPTTLVLCTLLLIAARFHPYIGTRNCIQLFPWTVFIYLIAANVFGFQLAVDQWVDAQGATPHGWRTGPYTQATLFLMSVFMILRRWADNCCVSNIRFLLLYGAMFIPFNTMMGYAFQIDGDIAHTSFMTMMINGFCAWGLFFKNMHRRQFRGLVSDPQVLKIFGAVMLSTTLLIQLTVSYEVLVLGIDISVFRFNLLQWGLWLGIFIGLRSVSDITHSNRKLIEEKHELATLDRLTQTKNRLGFSEILNERDNTKDAGIIICDIDNFKNVNDTYGHAAGDRVLCEFARVLNHHSRDTDHVVRWGGEEFLIFTTNASRTGLANYCEKLRQAVNAIEFNFATELKITASFGATIIGPHDVFDDGVRIADEKLYYAKRNGKNRVVDDSIDHEVLIV